MYSSFVKTPPAFLLLTEPPSINKHLCVRHAVRSFGTEGRVEGSVIPPSQVLHDFVCFRGQDIMDLHVHDAEADEVRTLG